ncbi:MAG: lipopolysaccharide biosynthesis protein [Nannocystales bacterium]
MSGTRAGDFGRVASSLRWTLLGEVLFAAGQFGLMMVMARLGSDAALGRYALGLAIATPLFVLTSLHLRPTYVVTNEEELGFGHFWALRLLGAPAAVVLAAFWAVLAGLDTTTAAVVIWVALTRMSEMLADLCHAAAARDETLDRVGISRALRGMLLLGTVGGAMLAGVSESTALALGAVVALLLTLTYDFETARRHANLRPRFDRDRLWRLTVLAAPVGFAGGLLGLTTNTPAYVLEHSIGIEPLGDYAAIVSILFISGVLNAAVGGAAVPRLARLFETDRAAFVRLLLRVAAVVGACGLALLLACVLLGELYLAIAYGPRFTSLAPSLVYSGAIAFVAGLANMLSQTLVSMKRFRMQFTINAITFVVAVGLAFAFVPTHGVEGALLALGLLSVARFLAYVGIIGTLVRRREASV